MDGLTPGRIVHFVLPDDWVTAGTHRPAIVVDVQPNQPIVTLIVFMDLDNDKRKWDATIDTSSADRLALRMGSILNARDVSFSEEPKPRTWHWIEKA